MNVSVAQFRRVLLVSSLPLCAAGGAANAVSWSTKMACASDYYAYCSQYSSGTPEVAKCMRANGSKLSNGCIRALISEGLVSQADIARHKERMAAKAAGRKPVDGQKARPEIKTADATKKKIEQKPPVAENSKPKTKPAETVVAALSPPKPKLVRVGQVRSLTNAGAGESRLAMNSETYSALRNREARFVAPDDYVAPIEVVTHEQPQPAWPVAEVRETAAADVPEPTARAEPQLQNTQPKPVQVEVAEVRSNWPTSASAVPAKDYPEGRMSLGRESEDKDREQSSSPGFWSRLIETLSGH